MQVQDALRERRSVRSFLSRVPDAEVVRRLMEQAALAPSGGNLQPWRVVALAGDALADLKTAVKGWTTDTVEREPSYPPSLWDPYRTRRYKNGEDLYRSIGVPREDKSGRLAQMAKNADLFGAPVALFVATDQRMGRVQWIDLGSYLQSLLLLASSEGLATCAQGFWRRYDPQLSQHLQLPEGYEVAFGIALGYEDSSAPINTLRADRADFDEWASMRGF